MSEWFVVGDCQYGPVFYNPETKALKVPIDEDGTTVIAEDWESGVGEPQLMRVDEQPPNTIFMEPREYVWNVRSDEEILGDEITVWGDRKIKRLNLPEMGPEEKQAYENWYSALTEGPEEES